jgi:methyl-accepting chemotaxis protein
MDNVTQQNAALVEETAAGSQTLEQQANDMLRLVGSFDLGDGGDDMPVMQASRARPSSGGGSARPAAKSAPAKPAARKPAPKPARNVSHDDDEWEEF